MMTTALAPERETTHHEPDTKVFAADSIQPGASGSSASGLAAHASGAEPAPQEPVASTSQAGPKRSRASKAFKMADAGPEPSHLPSSDPLHDIRPAYYYPGTSSSSTDDESGVPVFTPTLAQFSDFYRLCEAIDGWGMRSGIVKVIPPAEWKSALPDLRSTLREVRIRNAITQHFTAAASGLYRQTNVTRTVKVWNAKQWADTAAMPDQHGPEIALLRARSGEEEEDGVRTRSGKRSVKDLPRRPAATQAKKRRAQRLSTPQNQKQESEDVKGKGKADEATHPPTPDSTHGGPSTPTPSHESGRSPRPQLTGTGELGGQEDMPALEPDTHDAKPSHPPANLPSPANSAEDSVGTSAGSSVHPKLERQCSPSPTKRSEPRPDDETKSAEGESKPKVRKPQWADTTTPEEWAAFDFVKGWTREGSGASAGNAEGEDEPVDCSDEESKPVAPQPEDWDVDTCRAIEGEYWRGLSFGKPPMYGADLKGTLFTPETKSWNVGKLDNVLTRLRLKHKLPGVNTPYLYFGMWRATFAWHVEDMDLYSINYIHFGAPKQWYAIRQADARRFETVMAAAFPSDSHRCAHFMRHKSYLASPSFLAAHNIRPARLVQHAGEFVITYPYGYHSGYNLGFNCAESVNFALESWLDIGRRATYCQCSGDSVHMDVDALLEESKELEEQDRKKEERERARTAKAEAEARSQTEGSPTKKPRAKPSGEKRKRPSQASGQDAIDGQPDQKRQTKVKAENGAENVEEGASAKPRARPVKRDELPCAFCPSTVEEDLVSFPPLSAPSGSSTAPIKRAHRLCASFIPETWVGKVEGSEELEEVKGVDGIEKARYALKCQICPNPALAKQGAKIQCTRGKCPRSAHVSCALQEESGWFIDVVAREGADSLEGLTSAKSAKGKKKAGKSGSAKGSVPPPESNTTPAPQNGAEPTSEHAPATEAASAEADFGPSERLVVLCRAHNPLFKRAEEARKAAELRAAAMELTPGSMLRVKASGGGVWEVQLLEVVDTPEPASVGQAQAGGDASGSKETSAGGYVIVMDQGARRNVAWNRIIFDAPPSMEALQPGQARKDYLWHGPAPAPVAKRASQSQSQAQTAQAAGRDGNDQGQRSGAETGAAQNASLSHKNAATAHMQQQQPSHAADVPGSGHAWSPPGQHTSAGSVHRQWHEPSIAAPRFMPAHPMYRSDSPNGSYPHLPQGHGQHTMQPLPRLPPPSGAFGPYSIQGQAQAHGSAFLPPLHALHTPQYPHHSSSTLQQQSHLQHYHLQQRQQQPAFMPFSPMRVENGSSSSPIPAHLSVLSREGSSEPHRTAESRSAPPISSRPMYNPISVLQPHHGSSPFAYGGHFAHAHTHAHAHTQAWPNAGGPSALRHATSVPPVPMQHTPVPAEGYPLQSPPAYDERAEHASDLGRLGHGASAAA